MADKRKLQGEIDRTLKKVDEGVELFDEIWEKVYAARDPNHKEKYEQDLKKEIKKLQRHRDQIKTWMSGNEIKDKKQLMEARKLIETKMEQFKVCEKEAKTKTFSKEGLAREQKVDPKDKAKNDSRDWLQNCINSLDSQIESFDADLERLAAGKGKQKNKDEIASLEEALAGHRKHVAKLEQIIRLMDNDLLDPPKIDQLREDIEYFVDSNQEPDYQAQYDDDQEIYESLGLAEAPIQMVDLLNQEKNARKSPREGEEDGEDMEETEEADDATEEGSTTSNAGKREGKKAKTTDPALVGIGRPKPGAVAAPIVKVAPTPLLQPPRKPPEPVAMQTGDWQNNRAPAAVGARHQAERPNEGTGPKPVLPPIQPGGPTQAAVLAQAQQQRAVLQRQQQNQNLASQQQAVAGQQAAQQQKLAAQQAELEQQRQRDHQREQQQHQQQQQNHLPHPQDHAASDAHLLSLQPLQQAHDKEHKAPQPPPPHLASHPHQQQAPLAAPPQHPSPAIRAQASGQSTPLHSAQAPSPALDPLSVSQSPRSAALVSPLLKSASPGTSAQPLASHASLNASPLLAGTLGPPAQQPQVHAPGAPTHSSMREHHHFLLQQQQQQQQLQPSPQAQPQPPQQQPALQQQLPLSLPPQTASRPGLPIPTGTATRPPLAPQTPILGPLQQASPASTPGHAPTLGAGGEQRLLSEPLAPLETGEGEATANSGGQQATRTAPETLQMQLNHLNRAMLYIPTAHDSERPKQYLPRNPYPVNPAFPLTPAPTFESSAIFEKLGPDTLFFIFYYQQGTYQQYLAAKELKKQSWRYHKKYMTWFQRHEEPKITTDEFEQGTYVYFDCESGWCTRIKQEFTFEYQYLESEE